MINYHYKRLVSVCGYDRDAIEGGCRTLKLTMQRTAIIYILMIVYDYNSVQVAKILHRTPSNIRQLFHKRFRFKNYISMVQELLKARAEE